MGKKRQNFVDFGEIFKNDMTLGEPHFPEYKVNCRKEVNTQVSPNGTRLSTLFILNYIKNVC